MWCGPEKEHNEENFHSDGFNDFGSSMFKHMPNNLLDSYEIMWLIECKNMMVTHSPHDKTQSWNVI